MIDQHENDHEAPKTPHFYFRLA